MTTCFVASLALDMIFLTSAHLKRICRHCLGENTGFSSGHNYILPMTRRNIFIQACYTLEVVAMSFVLLPMDNGWSFMFRMNGYFCV